MSTYPRLPVAFVSGQGAWLKDKQGQAYLDALSGIAVCSLGHAHPAITATIQEQCGQLVHTSNLYEIPMQEKLAAELAKITALDAAFFCNSGAEANEAAIKLARRYARLQGNPEPCIVTMQGAFHGRTLGTLAASDSPKADFEPLPKGFIQTPFKRHPGGRGSRAAKSQCVRGYAGADTRRKRDSHGG